MGHHQERVIGGVGLEKGEFADALRGIWIDARGRLYAVGDDKLVVYSLQGTCHNAIATERPGYCVAVDPTGKIYIGEMGQVQIFDPEGKPLATWRDETLLGCITAIGFAAENVLLADVKDRCIRRYHNSGKYLDNIGKENRMQGFLIPNAYLDFAVDREGVLHVCNSGKHRVERYNIEDKLLGRWGRFGGGSDPEGFTGCCNPTNIALMGDGRIVVTTKAEPQVKLYSAEGKLLELFGEGAFDPNCKNMDVAADAEGRIYVVDTAKLTILVFAPDKADNRTEKPGESDAAEKKP